MTNLTVIQTRAHLCKVISHFTPVGSSGSTRSRTWFGIIIRQAIRRATFGSINVLISQVRVNIELRNTNSEPFTWTATADEIIANVQDAAIVRSSMGTRA